MLRSEMHAIGCCMLKTVKFGEKLVEASGIDWLEMGVLRDISHRVDAHSFRHPLAEQ